MSNLINKLKSDPSWLLVIICIIAAVTVFAPQIQDRLNKNSNHDYDYVNKKFGYSLTLPEGWSVIEPSFSENTVQIIEEGPQGSVPTMIAMIAAKKENSSLEELREKIITEVENTENLRFMEYPKTVESSFGIDFTLAQTTETATLKTWNRVIIKNNIRYIIGTNPSRENSYKNKFSRIVEKFTIL